MSLRASSFRYCCCGFVFAVVVAMGATLRAADGASQQNGTIQVSNPKGGLAFPNTSALGISDGSPEHVGPSFTSGQATIGTGNSLGGALPLPPPSSASAAPSEEGSDLLNFNGSTPEEMLRNMALTELLGLPKDAPITPEQSAALMRSISGQSSTSHRNSSERSSGAGGFGSTGIQGVAGQFGTGDASGADDSLNNLLGSGASAARSSSSDGASSSFSGIFAAAQGQNSSSAMQDQLNLAKQTAEQSQIAAFRRMLDAQTASPGAGNVGQSVSGSNPWGSTSPLAPTSASGETSVFGQASRLSQANPFGRGSSAFGRSVFASANSPTTLSNPAGVNSPLMPAAPKAPVPSSLDPNSAQKAVSQADAYRPPRMDFKIPRRAF